ncbi:MAG TPA: ABC transporter ATP-binding protein [Betaproteobacteria bacterium]|nr:ABC transporter ATP-binding protein [Betaproteobacteria bacterium]
MTRPREPGAVVLEFRDVGKTFHAGKRAVVALRQVAFTLRPGGVTGLIGPDGAGKTTVMRLAAGLLAADAGQITVLGLDVARDALAVQAAIGYMPQRFGLYEDLTVQENLDLYADLQGVSHGERAQRYRELMHMTGLAPFTTRLAARLSGGMKQKLGLACTLVRAPRLLLLDEPTVGVDPVSRRELWRIIDRLVEQEGMSVLLSTAYLDEAERCGQVVLLHQGDVLQQGAPGALSERMAGRSYQVTAAGIKPRALQQRLAAAPGAIDAVIHGDGVRWVTDQPAPEGVLPPDARVTAAAPRFEDSFIALLQTLDGGRRIEGPMAGVAAAGVKAAPAAPVIEVRRAQRRFGDFYAVRDVSFDVAQGEVFGLLGANGAGKSTTFRMLCGLLPASAGSLRVAGVDLRHAAAAARARIGYMSQKFSLYGNLTVRQNLKFFSSAYNLTGKPREARIAWALEEFDLAAQAEAVSLDLPLGYKQRLALACALMHGPGILFLDEPTSGVDPLARREFWRRINRLAESGVTVMVTTHFMEEAEYCDRLAIMAAGEILALGAPAEIKARAASAANPTPSMEEAFIALIEAQPVEAA